AVSIDALRGALVRAVRTATTEVDRRRWPRYQVSMSAEIATTRGVTATDVSTLSLGGVSVRGETALREGERVRLRISGLPETSADVLHVDPQGASLRFVGGTDEDPAFREAFERLTRGLRPLSAEAA
ncbi:MAG TPA: PilZ domain-containing protein, partial [Azospirillaceae bacterium]|nr:PilZ domain-containing protein [Azospirillaceae bacterium]